MEERYVAEECADRNPVATRLEAVERSQSSLDLMHQKLDLLLAAQGLSLEEDEDAEVQ